jgi:hypothetical protein
MKGIIVFLLVMVCSILLSSIAFAENAGLHEECTKIRNDMGTHLGDLATALQSKPVEEWSGPEVEDYLNSCMWYVYSGVMLYQNVERALPQDIDSLVNNGYLDFVPLNPFNEWKPVVMRVNDLAFHAGDICLQKCLVDSNDPPRKRSFEISVFGVDPDFATYGNAQVSKNNQDWAVVPNGALYQLGASFKRATGKKSEESAAS